MKLAVRKIILISGKKEQIKKADKKLKVPQKLTLKVFTEAALLHFVKNKFDPRYYQDDSIATSINRLRNHILGFIVTQENKYIRPFQQDIIALKNEVSAVSTSRSRPGCFETRLSCKSKPPMDTMKT